MSADLQASVVLITSSDPTNSRFGTGFAIHQDEQATYLLTCAHVVHDVGGAETIDIGGLGAAVAASGDANDLDLAVLRVEGLLDIPPLSLRVSGEKGRAFSTAGFQLFGRHYLIRPLQGRLGESVGLAIRGHAGYIKAWDLKIEDDYQLQPGYSGSPVVDEINGQVLGVVSHRQGQGERGLALSIEALSNVWPDMPSDLLHHDVPGAATPRPIADTTGAVKVFFSYAAQDKELAEELAIHLSVLQRQGKIDAWHEGEITAGEVAVDEINAHLNSADIILLLVSPYFIVRRYIDIERALQRHKAGKAVVIPVLLRPTVSWQGESFGKFKPLPRNETPVTDWADQDGAFFHIAEEIRRVAEKLGSNA